MIFQGPKGYIAKYVKYTCSMETVQQNGRFKLFSSKFPSNLFSLAFNKHFRIKKDIRLYCLMKFYFESV